MKLTQLVIAAAAVAVLFGCASPAPEPQQVQVEDWALADSQDYRIHAEDQLEVRVWRRPKLSVATEVTPDGKISMPVIGDVQAEGLTALQLKQTITMQLEDHGVTQPHVTVTVGEVRELL